MEWNDVFDVCLKKKTLSKDCVTFGYVPLHARLVNKISKVEKNKQKHTKTHTEWREEKRNTIYLFSCGLLPHKTYYIFHGKAISIRKKSVRLTSELNYTFDLASIEHFHPTPYYVNSWYISLSRHISEQIHRIGTMHEAIEIENRSLNFISFDFSLERTVYHLPDLRCCCFLFHSPFHSILIF